MSRGDGQTFLGEVSVLCYAMRRIQCIPGLFSLVLLLPLCLWYLHKQRAFREERCFNLAFLPEEGTDIDSVLGFDEWRVRHAKYAAVPPEFQIAGGFGEASGPLLGFRQRMMDLANARDTNAWVHVRFASDVT